MRIVISGIPIDIQKKNIKNMHLQIKPPDGHVVISAPLSMDDKAIEVYARTNLSWIKNKLRSSSNNQEVLSDSMLAVKLCTSGANSITYPLYQMLKRTALKFKEIK